MNQRMKAIAAAATRLFLRQGYSRTQMSHIAKEVGVSVGTIYLEFAGKKEILHFILKGTLDPDFPEQAFTRPLTDALFAGLEEEIIARFAALERTFAARLAEGLEGYTFEALLGDTFDLLAQHGVGCLFLEKNGFDFPRLAQHYRAYRKAFFKTMVEYLRAFEARGDLRPVEDWELTTMLIVETLSWWAMDVRYTAFEPREIPAERAKNVCLDNLVAAYKK